MIFFRKSLDLFKKNSVAVSFIFLLLLSFLFYSQSLRLFFFQDDFDWLYHANRFANDIHFLFTYRMSNFFMPVVNIYFLVAYKFFQLNPWPYHFVNLILHAGNAFLVFWLLTKLGYKRSASLAGGVAFVAVRYSVEAVVWISAVTILLFTTVALVAFLFWVKFLQDQKKRNYFLACLFLVVAFFIKEWSVLLVPGFIMLAFVYRSRLRLPIIDKKLVHQLVLPVVLSAVYLLFEFSLQSHSTLVSEGVYAFGFHAVKNVLISSVLIFIPLINSAKSAVGPWLVLAVIFLLVLTLLAFRSKRYEIFGWMFWIMLAFLPTSFFTHWQYTSRYGYLAGIGLAGLVAVLWEYCQGQKLVWVKLLALGGGIGWLVFQAYFINTMFSGTYGPLYRDTKNMVVSLGDKVPLLSGDVVYIYENNFLQYFLIPKISNLFYNKPMGRALLLRKEEACPAGAFCLRWNYKQGRFD